jgi:hypothetical protein
VTTVHVCLVTVVTYALHQTILGRTVPVYDIRDC